VFDAHTGLLLYIESHRALPHFRYVVCLRVALQQFLLQSGLLGHVFDLVQLN
jgi:hypothetical protein